MLGITNGDSAATRIELSGVSGDILPWRDVLHEGPVPSGLSLDKLREVRTRFITEQGWGDPDQVIRDFADRDSRLTGFREHEEVVLLFEHDLYDQLQLIQLLDWFRGRDLGATKLSLVCVDDYLGTLAPDRIRTVFRKRHEVSAQELELGQNVWQAFSWPDTTRISTLLRQDTSALPFLERALVRHLEQFPSVKNGLARSEAQALSVISGGRSVLREAFLASHQEQEDRIFLGDTIFALYLEGLSQGDDPLVLLEDRSRIAASHGLTNPSDFWNSKAVMTEAGYEVLEGRKDWIEINGIDRWLGGVHLSGGEAQWRWDESAQQLQHHAG